LRAGVVSKLLAPSHFYRWIKGELGGGSPTMNYTQLSVGREEIFFGDKATETARVIDFFGPPI
jgi:hypothetical protein